MDDRDQDVGLEVCVCVHVCAHVRVYACVCMRTRDCVCDSCGTLMSLAVCRRW